MAQPWGLVIILLMKKCQRPGCEIRSVILPLLADHMLRGAGLCMQNLSRSKFDPWPASSITNAFGGFQTAQGETIIK